MIQSCLASLRSYNKQASVKSHMPGCSYEEGAETNSTALGSFTCSSHRPGRQEA